MNYEVWIMKNQEIDEGILFCYYLAYVKDSITARGAKAYPDFPGCFDRLEKLDQKRQIPRGARNL